MSETLKLILVDVTSGLIGLYGAIVLFAGTIGALAEGKGVAIGAAVAGALVLFIAIKLEQMYGSASKSKAGEV